MALFACIAQLLPSLQNRMKTGEPLAFLIIDTHFSRTIKADDHDSWRMRFKFLSALPDGNCLLAMISFLYQRSSYRFNVYSGMRGNGAHVMRPMLFW